MLIKVGNLVGAPWTIALVVRTALVGAWLVRLQGLAALNRVRQSAARGELPALELLEGLFLLAAGALLLTPGFFTDIVGFVCLTPPLRRLLIRLAVQRFGPIHPGMNSMDSNPGKSSIETDYRRLDD